MLLHKVEIKLFLIKKWSVTKATEGMALEHGTVALTSVFIQLCLREELLLTGKQFAVLNTEITKAC